MSNNVYHDQLFQHTVEAVYRELIDCQELSAREAYIVRYDRITLEALNKATNKAKHKI